MLQKESFISAAEKGPVPVLYEELPYAPPAEVYGKFAGPGAILFESVKGHPKTARYSFIGFEPYMSLRVKDGVSEISRRAEPPISRGAEPPLGAGVRNPMDGGVRNPHPLRLLKELVGAYRQMPALGLPPFQGGAAGLFSYDFVHYFERLPKTTLDDLRLPDAHFFFFDRLIAFDHLMGKSWAIVCPGAREGVRNPGALRAVPSWAEEFDKAVYELEDIRKRATGGATSPCDFGAGSPCDFGAGSPRGGHGPQRKRDASSPIETIHTMDKKHYIDMVKRAKEYIAAGDIFQANISLRVSAHIGDIRPWDLYLTLRTINPSPFACFMDFGDYFIVGSSPERLLLVRDGAVETRPIAGTRPRGRDRAGDEAMRRELLLNEKERAEHVMLIDLERNDLGKVSDYGSVSVDELMITEDCSHVIHIVSNIKGRLAPGKDMFDSIRAAFPGGTITGVPKVRCMEIIDELEPLRRGPYTGSAGYFGFSGNADFNIVIRTFVIKDGTAHVQAGAGIVADSVPEREYEESLKKAEALIKTLTSALAGKT